MTQSGFLDSMRVVLVHGGIFPYVSLGCAVAALAFALAYVQHGVRRLLAVGATLVGVCVVAGLVGTHVGHRRTDEAIAMADPEVAQELREVGYAEADAIEKFAGLVALLPALLLAAGFAMHAAEGRGGREA